MTRRTPFLGSATVVAFLLLLAGLVSTAVPAQAGGGDRHGHRPDRPDPLPLLFVHGGAGSAQQYQTPAKRFTSNGFPIDHIAVFEYDSTFKRNTQDEVQAALDKRVDELKAQFGVDKIDLAGHSLGTFVSQTYLNTPEHAAKVAHYVNYDGGTNAALPGGVPTLAIWGQGPDTRTIVGAENVKLDQSHTQTVTSAESFAAVYKFLTGTEPRTTDVVPAPGPFVEVAGRLAIFPENYGPEGSVLDVYRVDGRTGARLSSRPQETFKIGADGNWGPFHARKGAHYEFVSTREGNPLQQHWYAEPFVRDDHLVRLLTGEPGAGVGALVEGSDRHSALVITRNKEWWGDQGVNNDVLEIDGTNVINAADAPQSKRAIAVFAFDKGSDGVTNLDTPIPDISSQIFLTAVDLYVPAADQPRVRLPWCNDEDRTVTVRAVQRGGGGKAQVINVPNWKSSAHRISVLFNEYV
jgi:pimeloyl-ACP methyl ester carboxylesterase